MRHLLFLLLAFSLVLAACTNEAVPADNKGESRETIREEESIIEQPNADVPKSPEVTQFTEENSFGALLIGTWKSVDDPKSQVTFTETERIDTYEGTDGTAVSPYEMAYNCEGDAPPSADGKAPSYLRTTEGNDDDQCWYVVSVTADRLELSYVGRGNTLVYERIVE